MRNIICVVFAEADIKWSISAAGFQVMFWCQPVTAAYLKKEKKGALLMNEKI